MPPKTKDDSYTTEAKYEAILDKLEQLCSGRNEDKVKLDKILDDNAKLQDDFGQLKQDITAFKERLDAMDKNITDIQKDIAMKVDIADFERFKNEMYRKIDDLVNRSKRNNMIFWNIPENEEKARGCIKLLEDVILNHMKLPDCEQIVIERAHRQAVKDLPTKTPRPIFCRFLHWGDKEYVLKRAPKALKDNLYGAGKGLIFVTDDVSHEVRRERKTLREEHLSALREKSSVKVAFILFLVPARIQYKEGDSWKFLYLPKK